MTRDWATRPTQKVMNPNVQAIYNQIGPLAFSLMRASALSPDNRKNALQWKMKDSRFKSIRIKCQQDGKGYQVSFFIINHQQFTEIVIEQVTARELNYTIERMTGLCLSSNVSSIAI